MSELATNSLDTKPEATQAETPEEKASQSAGFGPNRISMVRPPLSRLPPRHARPANASFRLHPQLVASAVPVAVTLAEKKQKLGRILEIGPGQILQFDKSCEEALDMQVSNAKIASGEAVKVGDKFGLRIVSIVPPDERFIPVRPARAIKSHKPNPLIGHKDF